MTLFEIIIICIVAALFIATIFVFLVCISYIKQVHITNKQVVTLTNAIFECRSFLEKLSKHDVIVKINNISGLEKKIGELLGICKNQTNNINSVKESLDNTMDDIKNRNNLIVDNHKLLDNINGKINKIEKTIIDINRCSSNAAKNTTIIKDVVHNTNTICNELKDKGLVAFNNIDNINQELYNLIECVDNLKNEITTSYGQSIKRISEANKHFGEAIKGYKLEEGMDNIKYIKEKLGEVSVDSEKYVDNFDKKLEDILSWTKRCKSGVEALIEGHNKGVDATGKSFDVINDILSNISDNIDNVIKNNKINNDEIAKISSILDTYREKVNYITTWIENATKLKTASKSKMVQTKTTTTPIDKKGVQKYL